MRNSRSKKTLADLELLKMDIIKSFVLFNKKKLQHGKNIFIQLNKQLNQKA